MESYLLFLLVCIGTILSPGPGVVLTLSNSLQQGTKAAFSGILGIACATFVIAAIAASSIGILLSTSVLAFTLMKYIGAAYLLYLGIRLLLLSRQGELQLHRNHQQTVWQRFRSGVYIQLSNPKAVFFFMSVFPQFIDVNQGFNQQFILLVSSYSLLVIVIHSLYAYSAQLAHRWLTSSRGHKRINQLSGSVFIGFAAILASAQR